MLQNIAVATGSRADYGLLRPILEIIDSHPQIGLQLIVTGAHHSTNHGDTRQIILDDGFEIAYDVEIPLPDTVPSSTAKAVGVGTIGFATAFGELVPSCLILLGDRYEMLAAAQAAMFCQIPVIHIHGGELTLGANDDSIRHAITKFAHLHFVAAEDYRRRVIQLGEEPDRVMTSGALGIDVINKTQLLSAKDLAARLKCDSTSPFILVSYHPETNAHDSALSGLVALFGALDQWPSYQIVITGSNADFMGESFSQRLKDYAEQKPNVAFFQNLGHPGYVSALAHAACLVGNSSSGILEAPWLQTPTVNIGDRQKGRIRAPSVIDCDSTVEAIDAAMKYATSKNFADRIATKPTLFGDGQAADFIFGKLIENADKLGIPKQFYDLDI